MIIAANTLECSETMRKTYGNHNHNFYEIPKIVCNQSRPNSSQISSYAGFDWDHYKLTPHCHTLNRKVTEIDRHSNTM